MRYQRMNETGTKTADPNWISLYRIGGAAALICAVMYLITLGVYVPANLASPPPETVLDWFTVFEESPVIGLFFLGLADILIMILWGPMSLALYNVLKQTNRSWSLIATPLVFVGMAVYLATNIAFSMLSLSQEYAAAATETERSLLLAAGQAMLAVSRGTGLYTGMALAWLAALILSVVMLRSKAFGKATAWVGILGWGLLVAGTPFGGHYTATGTPTALQSAVVALQYVGGGLLSLAWYILVGLRLLKISRS
jgi:fumarate reductase subunit D